MLMRRKSESKENSLIRTDPIRIEYNEIRSDPIRIAQIKYESDPNPIGSGSDRIRTPLQDTKTGTIKEPSK